MNDTLEIIQRWQDPGIWQTVTRLETQAAELDSQADKLGSDARFILDRGDIDQAHQLKSEADHLRSCAADVRRQRAELAGEFMRIESWVREHRPELLEFCPIATFEGDCSEAIQNLKRLESRFRTATPKGRRRTKPRMTVHQVSAHWAEVIASGNCDLIQEYLTLAETKLAKQIGCSRNTLRACESFQNRDVALREFNRQNR